MLTPELRTRIEQILADDRYVLFMKGTRDAPRCGFSARVVDLLDGYLDRYQSVDILADADLREALKEYSSWPTYPQLYVDGALVGGADILHELHDRGELALALGPIPPPTPPVITLTPRAADHIRATLDDPSPQIRLVIDQHFSYEIANVGSIEPGDSELESAGVRIVIDRASARRADGMTMDAVPDGEDMALLVDNPNEPATVKALDVQTLKGWLDQGAAIHLFDVRTPAERAIARIQGSILLDEKGIAMLRALPKDARIVLHCHHGVRSMNVAEHLLTEGYTDVYNVEGGIDAWSLEVDPGVARY